jgi:hypothetical protein
MKRNVRTAMSPPLGGRVDKKSQNIKGKASRSPSTREGVHRPSLLVEPTDKLLLYLEIR